MLKRTLTCAVIICAIVLILIQWTHITEDMAYKAPNGQMCDLDEILNKEEWDESDYRSIFYQTGLSRRAISMIPENSRNDKILRAQQVFFTEPAVECSKNGIILWQEQNINTIQPEIIGIQNGDILVSFCTHTYGWRNGHVGIIVDASEGKTLEAMVMGEDSCVQSIRKWQNYPSFIILRLKDVSLSEREAIAEYALKYMEGIPYGFVTDVLEHIIMGDIKPADTDCSHLIWKSYMEFGYDLDSDGGLIVTPRDIAESPLLEVVQVYGIDLDTIKVLDE